LCGLGFYVIRRRGAWNWFYVWTV